MSERARLRAAARTAAVLALCRTAARTSAVLALCLAAALACSPERRLARHRERAEQLAAAGDYTSAAIETQAALQIAPDDGGLHLRLAELLSAAGVANEALPHFETAHRLAPEQSDAALALAGALAASEPARADELARAVVAREPELAAGHALRGEIALALGDGAAAREAAERAVALAPGDAYAHFARGRVRFATLVVEGRAAGPDDAERAAALADFDAAIARGDGATRRRARAARARLLAGWPGHAADAASAFRERIALAFAEESRAEQVDALRAAQRFARRTGDGDLMRFALEQELLADPANATAWRELASVEERAGRSADPVLARILAARPGDPAAIRLRAEMLVERKRFDEAIESLVKADPSPEILELLARVNFDQGRSEAGAAALARLEREYPDDPATTLGLAREALRAGRAAEAIEPLRDVTARRDSDEVQRLLAAAYLQTGRVDDAADALARAKELGDAGSPRVLRLALRIDHAAGRWQQAVRDAQKLRARGLPMAPVELVALAESLYELGQPAPARKVLERVLALPEPPAPAVIEFAKRAEPGERARAAELLASALARAPQDLRLAIASAALEAARGEVDGALARLAAAAPAEAGPPPISLALERARILASAGRSEAAAAELLAILARAPELRTALDLLTDVYRSAGSLDAEIAALDERAKRGDLDPLGRLVLARLHWRAGRAPLARAELERVIAERGDLPGAKRDLAALLAAERADLPRARALAEEARAGLPADAEAARVLGLVLLRSGDARAALDALDEARRLARGRPDATLPATRGEALEALGRKPEAKQAFAAALRIDPEHRAAREGLARLERD